MSLLDPPLALRVTMSLLVLMLMWAAAFMRTHPRVAHHRAHAVEAWGCLTVRLFRAAEKVARLQAIWSATGALMQKMPKSLRDRAALTRT